MEKEDKELLLKDLCSRQQYGVKLFAEGEDHPIELHYVKDEEIFSRVYQNLPYWVETVKPYLVSPSSLPAEDVLELGKMIGMAAAGLMNTRSTDELFDPEPLQDLLEVCYKEHIDINGLIPKGLALEAPKDMYGAKKIMNYHSLMALTRTGNQRVINV